MPKIYCLAAENMQICLLLIIAFAKCPFPHSIDTEKVQKENRTFDIFPYCFINTSTHIVL